MMLFKIYYMLKPIIPRSFQILLRRLIARYKLKKYSDSWPIDYAAATPPNGWKGWKNNKKFALILGHDVDTQKGHDKVIDLLKIEKELGFRSAFNIVPERYKVSNSLIETIKGEGFEVNVHGLNHDGKLFSSKAIFNYRAKRINYYLKKWESSGFTAPSMHHNMNWLHELNINHSTSTFDTDPFEPQPNGVQTIFPFWVNNSRKNSGYLEIPYTLPQDHLLFVILRKKNIEIWKKKLKWIAENGGMVMVNTHTDYMSFSGVKLNNEQYPVSYYKELLKHIENEYHGMYCNLLPDELTDFWIKTYIKPKS